MGTTADKLDYLRETKDAIRTSLVNKGAEVTEKTPFREYASAIDNLSAADGDIGKPYIDTSKIENFSHFFYSGARSELLKDIDFSSGNKFSYFCYCFFDLLTLPLMKFKGACNNAFVNCIGLIEIPQIDLSNCTDISYFFNECYSIKSIAKVILPTSSVCKNDNMFDGCSSLESINLTVSQRNFHLYAFRYCTALKNITIGEGWAVSIYLHYSENLTVESLHGMIENLADLTGQTAKTFQVGSTNLAKIDADHITMLQNKNWNYS